MADRYDHLSIPTDDAGFVSFGCPFCDHRFKLQADECQAEDVIELFCPACGLQDSPSSFLPRDVQEAARIKAENIGADVINDFMKQLERSFRGSKYVKFTPGKPLPKAPEKVLNEPNDLEQYDLPCCRRIVKISHLGKHTGVYCPYCGGMV